jgi:hypothetical protein
MTPVAPDEIREIYGILPWSREFSEIRGPALLLRRPPPVFCQDYNIRFAKMSNQTYRILKKLLHGAVTAREGKR